MIAAVIGAVVVACVAVVPLIACRWSTSDGVTFADQLDRISAPVPEDWDITSTWSVMRTHEDPDGWSYATDFSDTFWYSSSSDGLTRKSKM